MMHGQQNVKKPGRFIYFLTFNQWTGKCWTIKCTCFHSKQKTLSCSGHV